MGYRIELDSADKLSKVYSLFTGRKLSEEAAEEFYWTWQDEEDANCLPNTMYLDQWFEVTEAELKEIKEIKEIKEGYGLFEEIPLENGNYLIEEDIYMNEVKAVLEKMAACN